MIYPSGTPTQPEIISVALLKLELRSNDIFADIGCGSGSVSIKTSPHVKQVYAIDNRVEAISATSSNLQENNITNVKVLKGEASDIIPDFEIDCAFLGGSKNIEETLMILIEKVPRFVVSAVRLETVNTALDLLKENGKFRELLQIYISRGSDLAGGTMLKPEHPVFLIVGGE